MNEDVFGNYYGRNGVCFPLHSDRQEKPIAKGYSTGIFLGKLKTKKNMFAFVLFLLCYKVCRGLFSLVCLLFSTWGYFKNPLQSIKTAEICLIWRSIRSSYWDWTLNCGRIPLQVQSEPILRGNVTHQCREQGTALHFGWSNAPLLWALVTLCSRWGLLKVFDEWMNSESLSKGLPASHHRAV